MFSIRRSEERGHGNYGWLDTRHTFSFGEYYDPNYMGFRALRVINDDRVAPGGGFPTHPHRDMEILTYVLQGALEHKDSMGNGSIIRPGDVQRMSAGTGVFHSEFNPSSTEPVHLLQIWLLPERRGLTPEYEQRSFAKEERHGRLRLVASPDGQDDSVTIHQDARLFNALLSPGQHVSHTLAVNRHAWVQLARGSVRLFGEELRPGDGAAIAGSGEPVTIESVPGIEAEILLFDLS